MRENERKEEMRRERQGGVKEKQGARERERERSGSESQVTATQKHSGGKSQTLEPINSLHMFGDKSLGT